MAGTRRTAILATAAVAILSLARQINVGVILHGGVVGKKKPEPLPLGKGLTTVFEATSNQTHSIDVEGRQSGGGGGYNVEREDEYEDNHEGKTTTTTRTIAQLMTSGANSSTTIYFIPVPDPPTIIQLG